MCSSQHSCPILTKFGFWKVFIKTVTTNFTEIYPVETTLIHAGRLADGWRIKVTNVFYNYAIVPTIYRELFLILNFRVQYPVC
jgi:hypothetical protein